jgi:ribosome-binding protein aMBF1 (putative translation factor)
METHERCEICKKEEATQSITTSSGFEIKVCEGCYQNIKKLEAKDETELRKQKRGFLAKLKGAFKK